MLIYVIFFFFFYSACHEKHMENTLFSCLYIIFSCCTHNISSGILRPLKIVLVLYEKPYGKYEYFQPLFNKHFPLLIKKILYRNINTYIFFSLQTLPDVDWHCMGCCCKFCGLYCGKTEIAFEGLVPFEISSECLVCERRCMSSAYVMYSFIN